MPSREDRVLDRIRNTPEGFVRAYGDVSPGAPRFAGTVLAGNHDSTLPWWRIVRSDGTLAKGARQRKLLEAEGIPFRGDRVDMRAARLPD
jgi:methylated-DNA-protein-cysteine methyltransferase related protein